MGAHRNSTRLIAVVLGIAAIGAACGDDDGESAGGGSVEEWCGALALGQEGDVIFDSLATADPAALEAGMDRVVEIVEEVQAAAPPEIAADVEYLAEYTSDLQSSLAAADYNVFDADLSFVDEARIDQTQANLDDFSERECGQPFGDDDRADAGDSSDDDAFDPAAGTIRDQLVQQFMTIGFTQQEAECIADGVDPTDESVLSGDEEEILALFEVCEIPLSRLAELGG